jgi:outer membrane protein OmpA-like peptidoglycan-associated protein
MKMSLQRAILLALCGLGLSQAVQAADSTVVLVMGGEAYDGPPKFEVEFAGVSLGEGAVAAAIDTASGRFADASDKSAYVQTFTFMVPEASFREDGDVVIRFLNEAYGGPGSTRDRNLFLASVTVNGQAITASGLSTREGRQPVPNEMLGEFLVIADSSKNVVTEAPDIGWPMPVVLPPPEQIVAATPVEAKPVDATPAKVEQVAAVEPIETAGIDQDPEASSLGCDLDEIYNVVGFNTNSNELTPRLIERLDQVAADIGGRECNVTVTGYSSKEGAIASNALFAVERAQNSLSYLREKGVRFAQATATGVGATDAFGPDFASNRRVVITVTP